MYYKLTHALCTLITKVLFFLKVEGRENIPREGSFILASNHISNLDPFLVGTACTRRIGYLAKESLFKNKILGAWLASLGAFAIKRNNADFRAVRMALRKLKDGLPILIFPEGTRKRDSEVEKKVQPGIGLITAKSQVPVVPVFIHGSDKALPPGAKFPRFRQVVITFGKPTQYAPQETYRDIASEIMHSIRALRNIN